MHVRTKILVTTLGVLALTLLSQPAKAGCGCAKPAPPLAEIRPPFASPGDQVALFPDDDELVEGARYQVAFKSEAGGSGSPWTYASATAVSRRDYADGARKLQLVVSAPELPPGPTRVLVTGSNGDAILEIPNDQFTMLQRPIALGETDGVTVAKCYRAAVGADGTVYLPVDISAISDHMYFSGIGMDYPLLFGPEDITIYNTQGILMQLLNPDDPSIYAILDPYGHTHSFELLYDRHEFNTYRDKHLTDAAYASDPTDPAWHVDGTRHIDHDRLVLAIRGVVEDEGLPAPGVTPPFNLDIASALADGTAPVSSTTIIWSAECAMSTP